MFAAGKTAAVSGAGPDAQFNYVTMLLHGDGTNGAQNNTFLDSSTNNFTITRNGNTTQGSFSPYGSNWSNYLNGSSGAGGGPYLSFPNSSTMQLGSGNFTIEAWCYFNVVQESTIIARFPFDSTNNEWILQTGSNLVPFFSYTTGGNASAGSVNSSSALSINTWYHIAVVRNSSTLTLYINGTSVATSAISATIYSGTTTSTVGAYAQSAYPSGYAVPNGYLSNVRVVKGTAVYTSNFTPSTTPLTAISGTSLLTCQSNRYIDNSSNNFTATVVGTPSVQRFNPFGTATAYSTAVIGGSGYFDGTGDYLACGSQSAYAFGTGDFTLNAWVYLTSAPYYMSIADTRSLGWALAIDASRSIYLYSDVVGYVVASAAGAVPLNAWTYVTVTRVSGTMTLYLNAVSINSASNSTNFSNTTLAVGANPSGGEPFFGYICDFQAIKGTGTTPTLPTAPLTNVTNTSLLLNFTNGAIFDNAMMNNLETVGNAQISTSVVKYGTGSLAFDGTGDYLSTRSTPNLAFGSGDFTIECWVYANSLGSYNAVFAQFPVNGGSASNSYVLEAVSPDMQFYWIEGTTLYGPATLGTVTTGAWIHYAICRSGNTLYPFKNGVLGTTLSITQTLNSPTSAITIGGEVAGGGYWNGYIDDLRITKGYARYTTTFTPPTKALSDTGPI